MRYKKILSFCLSSALIAGSVLPAIPVMADTVTTEDTAGDVVEKCDTHTYDENSITWYVRPNMGNIGDDDTLYDVSVASYENGTVTITDTEGKENSSFTSDGKVMIKAEPDEGYKVGLIALVYSNGDAEDITTDSSFDMPGEKVIIKVCFVKDGDEIPSIEEATKDLASGDSQEDDEYIGYAVRTCTVCGASESVKAEKISEEEYDTAASEGVCGGTGVKFHFKASFSDGENAETDYLYTIGASHDFDEGEVTKEATCSTPGILTKTCKNCKETETETIDIDPDAHVIVYEVTTPATCTTDGVGKQYCSECGALLNDNITIKAGHVYEEEITKAPTCTEKGVKTFKCKNCDASYTEDIDMTDHNYGEGVVTTRPMFGKTGVMTYTCKDCGASYTEEIPAITECTHTEEAFTVETIEPTCAVDGKKIYTCSECGYSYETKISATGNHEYDNGTVTKEATCTEKGIKTFKCKNCDNSYTEEIPMTDHQYDDGVVTVKPTFEKEGVKTYTCKNCGTTKTETIPQITDCEHHYTKEVKDATCKEDGLITYTCDKCQYSYTEKIPATGNHKYVSSVTKEATCTEKGVKTYTCEVCGDSYTEEIPMIDHEYGAWVTIKESTCAIHGIKTRACKYCGKSQTEELALKPHTHVVVNEQAATCVANGYTGDEICSVCKKTFSVGMTIPPTGHDFQTKVVRNATCTENGVKETRCTRCNKLEKSESIAKTGHSFTNKITKEATCTEDGVRTFTCQNCNYAYTEKVPRTGHTFSDWTVASNATVFKETISERSCLKCGAKETKAEGSKLTPFVKTNASTITLKKKQSTTGLKIDMAAGDYVKTYVTSNSKLFKVTGKQDGACKITAQNRTGKGYLTIKLGSGVTKKITIKVQKGRVGVSSIGSLPKNITIDNNKSYNLKPVINPFTSTYKASYSSTNKKIATVNKSGKITGKKKGTCYIKVKAGSKTVKVKISVK